MGGPPEEEVPCAGRKSRLPCATRRGPKAQKGALCVYVGSGAVLAAPVLYVTLPSRVKSCQTRGSHNQSCIEAVGKRQSSPGQSMADCWSLAGSFLKNWKADVTSLLTPPTAGSLSASPMPYAWAHCHRICNICGSHAPRPHPTRAAPELPRLWLPGPPQRPLPICLHTENGA